MVIQAWNRLATTVMLVGIVLSPALATAAPLEINQACAVSPGGCFDGDTGGYPVTISSPGSYILTSDLDVPSNAHGLYVDVIGGVTLDLRGFTLSGGQTCSGSGASITCTGVTSATGVFVPLDNFGQVYIRIRNGRIRGFGGSAIVAQSGVDARNLMIVENSTSGIDPMIRSRIGGCVIERNGGDGIESFARGLIYGTTIRGNAGDGVNTLEGLLHDSTSEGNGENGIVSQDTAISEVSSRGNADHGVRLYGNTLLVDSVIANNTLSGVEFNYYGYAARNVVHSNGTWGFDRFGAKAYYGNSLSGNSSGDINTGGINMGENACSGVVCP